MPDFDTVRTELPRLANPLQTIAYDHHQLHHFHRHQQRDVDCRVLPLRENLRFLVFFIIPVVAAILLIPYCIDPYTIENFKTNFNVIVLSQQFCNAKPAKCRKLLDPNYGDLALLKRKAFHTYDIIYVRHYTVEIWDGWVLGVLRKLLPRKAILFLRRLSSTPMESETIFWLEWDESMELMLAMMNSMVFHTVKGLLVSRMWVFFIFGSLITIVESWASIAEPLYNVLRSDTNVY